MNPTGPQNPSLDPKEAIRGLLQRLDVGQLVGAYALLDDASAGRFFDAAFKDLAIKKTTKFFESDTTKAIFEDPKIYDCAASYKEMILKILKEERFSNITALIHNLVQLGIEQQPTTANLDSLRAIGSAKIVAKCMEVQPEVRSFDLFVAVSESPLIQDREKVTSWLKEVVAHISANNKPRFVHSVYRRADPERHYFEQHRELLYEVSAKIGVAMAAPFIFAADTEGEGISAHAPALLNAAYTFASSARGLFVRGFVGDPLKAALKRLAGSVDGTTQNGANAILQLIAKYSPPSH